MLPDQDTRLVPADQLNAGYIHYEETPNREEKFNPGERHEGKDQAGNGKQKKVLQQIPESNRRRLIFSLGVKINFYSPIGSHYYEA